jgi:hypothetical protein
VALTHNELEPLFVVDHVTRFEVPPKDLCGHLAQTFTTKLVREVDYRELVRNTKDLTELAYRAGASLRVPSSFFRNTRVMLVSLSVRPPSLKEALPFRRCGCDEVG